MEAVEQRLKENYKQNLDPHEFLQFKLEGLKGSSSENNYDFWFKSLHEIFSSGVGQGGRLLDLGSGPTMYNIATAAAYVPYIVLSDFLNKNCRQLSSWLRGDPDRQDWTPFLTRVAMAEGHSNPKEAVPEIEVRIQSAVKAVVQCDVLEDQVIPKEYTQEPYDVILTSLTFETAAVSLEAYSKIVARTNRLLRTGGKLIVMGVLNCTFWQVGKNKFHCLYLKKEDIQSALENNGFVECEWKIRERSYGGQLSNASNVFFLTCTKLKEAL